MQQHDSSIVCSFFLCLYFTFFISDEITLAYGFAYTHDVHERAKQGETTSITPSKIPFLNSATKVSRELKHHARCLKQRRQTISNPKLIGRILESERIRRIQKIRRLKEHTGLEWPEPPKDE